MVGMRFPKIGSAYEIITDRNPNAQSYTLTHEASWSRDELEQDLKSGDDALDAEAWIDDRRRPNKRRRELMITWLATRGHWFTASTEPTDGRINARSDPSHRQNDSDDRCCDLMALFHLFIVNL